MLLCRVLLLAVLLAFAGLDCTSGETDLNEIPLATHFIAESHKRRNDKKQYNRKFKYDPALIFMGLGKRADDPELEYDISDENFDPTLKYMDLAKKGTHFDPALRYMGLGKRKITFDPAMKYMGLGKRKTTFDPAMKYMGLGKRKTTFDPAMKYMGLGKRDSNFDPALKYMGLGKRDNHFDPALKYMGLGKRDRNFDPALKYMGLGKRNIDFDSALKYMGLGKRYNFDPALRYMGLGKRDRNFDPALKYMGLGKRSIDFDPAPKYIGLGKRYNFDPALRYMGLGKRDRNFDPALKYMGLGKRDRNFDPALKYMGLGKRKIDFDPAIKYMGLGKRVTNFDLTYKVFTNQNECLQSNVYRQGKYSSTSGHKCTNVEKGNEPVVEVAKPHILESIPLGTNNLQWTDMENILTSSILHKKSSGQQEAYDVNSIEETNQHQNRNSNLKYSRLGKRFQDLSLNRQNQYDPVLKYIGLGKKKSQYDPALRYMGLGKKNSYDSALKYMILGKNKGQFDPTLISLNVRGVQYDPALRYMGLGKKRNTNDPSLKYAGIEKRTYLYDPGIQGSEEEVKNKDILSKRQNKSKSVDFPITTENFETIYHAPNIYSFDSEPITSNKLFPTKAENFYFDEKMRVPESLENYSLENGLDSRKIQRYFDDTTEIRESSVHHRNSMEEGAGIPMNQITGSKFEDENTKRQYLDMEIKKPATKSMEISMKEKCLPYSNEEYLKFSDTDQSSKFFLEKSEDATPIKCFK